MKKGTKKTGKRSPILCNEGRTKVNISNNIINFLGLRPYFLFIILRMTHKKNGSRAIKEKRKENLHKVKVKNLGARENARDENQRLL